MNPPRRVAVSPNRTVISSSAITRVTQHVPKINRLVSYAQRAMIDKETVVPIDTTVNVID